MQIAAVTETWGKQWKEVTLEIKDFDIYRKDRVGGRKGGGYLIYVSNKLKSYACSELENLPGEDSVWCWVKLTNETKILVGCIYRSTSSEDTNNDLLMNQIIKANDVAGNSRILIMGDFNVKEINWLENEVDGGPESFPFLFNECTKDCFSYQHVTEPTRFRGEQESLLDLIFTKEEDDVKNIEILSPLGKSDHGVVMCDVICEWKANAFFIPINLCQMNINRTLFEIKRYMATHG